MNNIIKRKWNQNSMVIIEDLQGMAFQAESGGHTFQISGIDGEGNAVALSGTPAGVMLRADGQDVTLTCSASEGVISATLPANAYSVPGRFGLTIFLTSDGQKTAIYAAVGTVGKTSSGTVAPPAGSDVVTLVNQINTAIAAIPANYNACFAPAYSTSGLYSVGQYVTYNGNLYRCNTAITTAETWTAAHWTQTNLGADVYDLKSAFIATLNPFNVSGWESGAYNSANGGNYADSNTIRNQQLFGLSQGSVRITCDTGYRFVIYAWDSEGNFVGSLKTGYTFDKTWSNLLFMTEFDFGMFPSYSFKVAMQRNPASTSIANSEGSHCYFHCMTDKTLTKENKAADAKKVSEDINKLAVSIPATNKGLALYDIDMFTYGQYEEGEPGTYYKNRIRFKELQTADKKIIVESLDSNITFSVAVYDGSGTYQYQSAYLKKFVIESGKKYAITIRDETKTDYSVYADIADLRSKVGINTSLCDKANDAVQGNFAISIDNVLIENGAIADGANTTDDYNAARKRRTVGYLSVPAGTIIRNTNTDYRFGVASYNYNYIYKGTSGWVTDETYTVSETCLIRIVYGLKNDNALSDYIQPTIGSNITVEYKTNAIMSSVLNYNILLPKKWETAEKDNNSYSLDVEILKGMKFNAKCVLSSGTITDCMLTSHGKEDIIRYLNANTDYEFTATEDITSFSVYIRGHNSAVTKVSITSIGVAQQACDADASLVHSVNEAKNKIDFAKELTNSATTVPLCLLHFSDIHGGTAQLKRIVEIRDRLSTVLDDVICTGDMVVNSYDANDGMDFWYNTSGTEKIMMCIGNHDVHEDGNPDYNKDEIGQSTAYTLFFAPNISQWGVTYESGKTYFYKDYATKKVRLIVLNYLLEDDEASAQNTWLQEKLTEAKTNGYTVVIAEHVSGANGGYSKINCNFTMIDKTVDVDLYPSIYQESVQDFIDEGGDFACYLVGHTHWDTIGYSTNYPNQIFVAVTIANASGTDNDQIRTGDVNSTAVNAVVIDTTKKTLKIIRIGANMDNYLRERNAVCISYANNNVISQS